MFHIGLIPDGTRRWARKNSKPIEEAYFQMVLVIARSIDLFFSQGAFAVSVYLLSKDNLQRSQKELTAIFKAEIHLIKELIPPLSLKHDFDMVLAGSLSLLPSWVKDTLSCQPIIKEHQRKLYLCLAYSPFDELQECLSQLPFIRADEVLSHLWVPQSIDLVIRTSGECRLSGFLPLQTTYSEILIVRELINDVTNDILIKCLQGYRKRTRRFGR
jgi:undecaprenyl diphosphate synthase